MHELGVQFRSAPTYDNPEDVGSWGCLLEELQANSCWWNRPEWLSNNEAEWPEDFEVTREVTEEVRPVQTQLVTNFLVNNDQIGEVTNVTSYSNLQKIESVTLAKYYF